MLKNKLLRTSNLTLALGLSISLGTLTSPVNADLEVVTPDTARFIGRTVNVTWLDPLSGTCSSNSGIIQEGQTVTRFDLDSWSNNEIGGERWHALPDETTLELMIMDMDPDKRIKFSLPSSSWGHLTNKDKDRTVVQVLLNSRLSVEAQSTGEYSLKLVYPINP